MTAPGFAIEIDAEDDGVTVTVFCDDLNTDAEAINWTYYYLGRYAARSAKLYRSYATDGTPTDLVAEIAITAIPRVYRFSKGDRVEVVTDPGDAS